jgi:hypothetical protein
MCLETPAGWILILRAAVLAHRKLGHCGVLAVVRNIPEERETRPAVGAAYERIKIVTAPRVEQLTLAFGTDGNIRRDGLEEIVRNRRRKDIEGLVLVLRFPGAHLDGIDPGP